MCQTTCKSVLHVGETTQEIIDALESGGCGPPLPHEPLWQCFLSADRKIIQPSSIENGFVSQINEIGMDSAKLHCCHKAHAPKCRRLCLQTFSNDWEGTRGDFEFDCYSQINEISLRQCLDEGTYTKNLFSNRFFDEIIWIFLFQLTNRASWAATVYHFVHILTIDRRNCFAVAIHMLILRPNRMF